MTVAGIVKAYEAVTQYCGFTAIEAGKTMGLSPYGKPNGQISLLYIMMQVVIGLLQTLILLDLHIRMVH